MSDISSKLLKMKALIDAPELTDSQRVNTKSKYEELLSKYGVDPPDNDLEYHWFRYKSEYDKRLLCQLIFMITGSTSVYRRTRIKEVASECTEFEASQIWYYYEYYREFLYKELDTTYSAFCLTNRLVPDGTTRVQATLKESNIDMDIMMRASTMEEVQKPNIQIE